MEIVTLRHSRCFENGNDDFGVEAFWATHCAHWSSGFMVLNASISRVLGQRPTFYCPLFVLCFFLYEKQEIRRRQIPAIDVWFLRCCRVEAVDGATVVARAIAVQIDPNIFFHCRPVDGATVMATKLVVEIGDAASCAGLSRVGYFIPLNAAR